MEMKKRLASNTYISQNRLKQRLYQEMKMNPAIPLLSIYVKKPNNTNLKRHMHLYVHYSITYNR